MQAPCSGVCTRAELHTELIELCVLQCRTTVLRYYSTVLQRGMERGSTQTVIITGNCTVNAVLAHCWSPLPKLGPLTCTSECGDNASAQSR